MDEKVINYLIHRSQSGEDERRGRRGGRRDSRDYEDGRDMYDYEDTRRGRGGRGRRGSRRDYEDRDMRDYEDDPYEDGRRGRDYEDSRDYREEPLYLSKTDIHKWKKTLKNYDGSMGEHYALDQILPVAHKMGVTFDDYDEKEFCIAVNMMYADYGGVLKKYISPDKELHVCVELAKAFLEDVDGPEPSEKLALYFHCIVCSKV